jgi:hypothetical protein
VGHSPQSSAQLEQFSFQLQLPSPHTGGVPPQESHTSVAALAQMESHDVSQQKGSVGHTNAMQASSPQDGKLLGSQQEPELVGQAPQSSGHQPQLSPPAASQTPSPHTGGGGASGASSPHSPHAKQASSQQSPTWSQMESHQQPAGATLPHRFAQLASAATETSHASGQPLPLPSTAPISSPNAIAVATTASTRL